MEVENAMNATSEVKCRPGVNLLIGGAAGLVLGLFLGVWCSASLSYSLVATIMVVTTLSGLFWLIV